MSVKAYEFPGHLTKSGKLVIPLRLRMRLSANQEFKVIFLIPDEDDEDDNEWSRMVAESFVRDEDPADVTYDKI